MNDRDRLPALIGDIYDAVLDPAQRIDVLEKIASFTDGHSSGLLSKHSLSHAENLYCCIGTDPDSLRVYSECYPKFDLVVNARSTGVEQVLSTADLVPYRPGRKRRHYHGWTAHRGDAAEHVAGVAECTRLPVCVRAGSIQ